MTMLHRVSRLFTIKTRFEAFLVIYAIAVGAAERGRHYLDTIPGWPGVTLALLCTGVVFIAGAKLLDAVKRDQRDAALAASPVRSVPRLPRRRLLSRSRPRSGPKHRAAESRSRLRKD